MKKKTLMRRLRNELINGETLAELLKEGEKAEIETLVYGFLMFMFLFFFPPVSSLLCYTCTSNEPGCTLDKVDWLIHSATSCPNYNDKCVKIIETTGGTSC